MKIEIISVFGARRPYLLVALNAAFFTALAWGQAAPKTAAPRGNGPKTALTPAILPAANGSDLSSPNKKEIAMQLVSSAENSSLDWKAQYGYIEDIGDDRGYTGGIIGFCSGTGDMLEVVQEYTRRQPKNGLAPYLPALKRVNGTASHDGLEPNFAREWKIAARDKKFRAAQDLERDTVYFNPAVARAKADGLRALGQFIYYDATVLNGPGDDRNGFGDLRKTALRRAKTPAQGGNEAQYLNAFLDVCKEAMKTEAAHSQTSRIDTAQRVFVASGNFDLRLPLAWKVYGDDYKIADLQSLFATKSGG